MPYNLNSFYLCKDFFRLSLNFIVIVREWFEPSQVAFKGCSCTHMVKHLSGGGEREKWGSKEQVNGSTHGSWLMQQLEGHRCAARGWNTIVLSHCCANAP